VGIPHCVDFTITRSEVDSEVSDLQQRTLRAGDFFLDVN
jgi:hypothetical protein